MYKIDAEASDLIKGNMYNVGDVLDCLIHSLEKAKLHLSRGERSEEDIQIKTSRYLAEMLYEMNEDLEEIMDGLELVEYEEKKS